MEGLDTTNAKHNNMGGAVLGMAKQAKEAAPRSCALLAGLRKRHNGAGRRLGKAQEIKAMSLAW